LKVRLPLLGSSARFGSGLRQGETNPDVVQETAGTQPCQRLASRRLAPMKDPSEATKRIEAR